MEDHRRFPTWFRLAMVCSGTACTILLMQTSFKWSFCITAALSLALLVFLVFRVNLAERLLASRPLWACMVARCAFLGFPRLSSGSCPGSWRCWRFPW